MKIKICHPYNLLVLSRIEFIFGMEVLSCHSSQSNLNNSFVLICIEFVVGMEVPWNDKHQPHSSLLW